MNQLIDTHAHLTWDSFKPDFAEVINRAASLGVLKIINVGADYESSKKAAKLECPKLQCYSTIGLHPHEISKLTTDVSIHQNVGKLEKLYQNNPSKIVAVGECGLDYHFAGVDYSPSPLSKEKQKELQKELFKSQIALAKRLNLPLIIHCRDAWENIFLSELTGTTGVFHSFTGTDEYAQKIINMGYYLGLTCIVTYPKNEALRQIIKKVALDKLLTETDCPYLPPQSMRGQRNEPMNVVEVVKVIAQVKNLPVEEVARKTFKNALELFKLEPIKV